MSDGPLTKRKMLSAINGVYDLLGLAAPVTIMGKIRYSEVCLRKLRWDQVVPDDIQRSWNNWLKGMEKCPSISVPHSVVSKDVRRIGLHGFAENTHQRGEILSCVQHFVKIKPLIRESRVSYLVSLENGILVPTVQKL